MQNKLSSFQQNQNVTQNRKRVTTPPSVQQPNKLMRINNIKDHFLENQGGTPLHPQIK